ncbi:MAG TPA: SGNH/GDSL hydrolase family protein [Candidatus Portnoybacteria bacterium]|nr:SGNH/GDSL hydrolase family protein [Candidatus Portnoybacteria bacterium]
MAGKLKPLLKNILLLLAACAFFFLCAEIACRLFYDEKVNYTPWIWEKLQEDGAKTFSLTDQDTYVNKDNGLYYLLDSNSLNKQRYARFNYQKTVKKEKTAEEYRVAIIGDSFTGSSGLSPDEKNYTAMLSEALNNAGQKSFNILPFSEGGINTYQELTILKEFLGDIKPDLVVLQYCDNDVEAIKTPYGVNNHNLWIDSRTDPIILDKQIVPALPYLPKSLSKFLLSNSAFWRFFSYKLNIISTYYVDATDTNSSLESLKQMKLLLASKGIPLVVIDFPPAVNEQDYCGYVSGEGGKKLQDEIRKMAVELNFSFLSLCDYVDDIHSLQSSIESNHYHYNTEGHRLAAEALKKEILNITKNEE